MVSCIFANSTDVAGPIYTLFQILAPSTGSVLGSTLFVQERPKLRSSVCYIIRSRSAVLQRLYVESICCKHTVWHWKTVELLNCCDPLH